MTTTQPEMVAPLSPCPSYPIMAFCYALDPRRFLNGDREAPNLGVARPALRTHLAHISQNISKMTSRTLRAERERCAQASHSSGSSAVFGRMLAK